MKSKLSLTFYTTPNRGMECGRELIVFRSNLAPGAGNSVHKDNDYARELPEQYHEGYNAWFLRGYDHGAVFIRLAPYFDPVSLREKAEAIEQGVLVDGEYDPEDLRRLADEIEKYT